MTWLWIILAFVAGALIVGAIALTLFVWFFKDLTLWR